jgi:hypothetical protein
MVEAIQGKQTQRQFAGDNRWHAAL